MSAFLYSSHYCRSRCGVQLRELELLDYLNTTVKNEDGVLLDARMPNWYNSETIPGAINVPFIMLTKASEKRDRLLAVFWCED